MGTKTVLLTDQQLALLESILDYYVTEVPLEGPELAAVQQLQDKF